MEKEEEIISDHDKKLATSSAITNKGAYAAISYMASAVLLVMFNKAALSSYKFPCANVITLFQMISSLALLYAMKRMKIISFKAEPQSAVEPTLVPLKTLVQTLPLAISYLLYMLVTMESVRAISVPMYTTLRRTTVAFTMIVEYFLTGSKHSYPVVGSVGIILLGAFIAGARDLSFDAYGYSVVFVANICTAVYLASIARVGKSSGLSTFGLMWNNLFTNLTLVDITQWRPKSGDKLSPLVLPRISGLAPNKTGNGKSSGGVIEISSCS
ncbi:hypothetical protein TIFTF001_029033 [Ficus carica]|uniref:Sugar phosphate transporter domain-containing protein n=1 Tax=Ficus carica TaxID=3494 RepID=A0AA88DUX0_FICCA|nr:hypothetical protein TIFTF001_029033 [Ficus carica]